MASKNIYILSIVLSKLITQKLQKMGNDKSKMQLKTLEELKKQLQQKNRHINKLRNQNETLVKQVVENSKMSKSYTMDNLMYMNYSMFTCMNCQDFFNQTIKIPVMICKNQHTLCQQCVKLKIAEKLKKCFQCDLPFQNMGKNRSILNLITNKEDLLAWMKEKDSQVQKNMKQAKIQSEIKDKLEIHMCKFLNCEKMFQINGDSLHKISPQDSWHTIRSRQNLPAYSKSQISLKVVNSLHNSIIVGITIQNQEFQKGFIPSNSVAFHLNNGHVYDQCGPNQSKWRSGGIPVQKNTNPRIVMTIDSLEQTVKWKISNKIYGQAKMPEKFLTQPIYVFVAIYHKGDIVVLNK